MSSHAESSSVVARPRVVLVDHYDSFTWNVVHWLERAGADVVVVPSTTASGEATSLAAIDAERPDAVVLSPGPGHPREARLALAWLARSGPTPTLGVCLGLQAIALAGGVEVGRAPRPVHGRVSTIVHDGLGLFAGLESPFTAMRYHSLAIESAALATTSLVVSASTDDGALVMGLRHRTLPIEAVQFHPESFLTNVGPALATNFVRALRTRVD